jgi:ArsR family transcriptional regulator
MDARAAVPEWLMIRAADQLRVLGQVARLRAIELLADGPQSPQQLSDALGLSQQNVSKHLQVLHSVGLLSRRREGSRVLYSLADEGVVEMLDRMALRISVQLVELSRAAGGHISAENDGDDERRVRKAAGAGS